MFKLWATILKDFRILSRDKAGLLVMFGMPVLLVVVIASIQNSTLQLVNSNKVPVLVCNRDTGECSRQLLHALDKIGMFSLLNADTALTDRQLSDLMHEKDALVAVAIPAQFSEVINFKATRVTQKALTEMGVSLPAAKPDTATKVTALPLTMYYNPVLQESFRFSIESALRSGQQIVENRQVLQAMYKAMNNEKLPEDLEKEILENQAVIKQVPVARDGTRKIPNATQHNVPAWTIFAMFFIVVSLSTGVVKEKLSGSFVRLKTLPTNYLVALTAKQITYVGVTLAQAAVIFSIGIFVFPYLGLPRLNMPEDMGSLVLITLLCGWCAVSYGLAVGIYARTMEQAVGFGAVSVVILAAIGGIIVPSFVMPESLRLVMKLSPLHWCLEGYYELFLEGGRLKDVLYSILPLFGITLVIQLIAVLGLRKQRLI